MGGLGRAGDELWLPPAHEPGQGSLRQRVAGGVRWTLIEQWGEQLLSLLGFVVIARLVLPSDMGLVALASVFVLFAQILIDAGMGAALVQRRVLARSHVDTAFWISLATGVCLASAGAALAIPLGAALGEPRLTPIVQVLSLTFVLYGLTSVQISLLRRELAMRSLALRGLVAVTGGAIVGIGLAYQGFGAWALVAQQLTAAALSVVMLWRASPWRPGRHVSRAHFRDLFSFGANIVGSNILTFFSRRTDNFLVGIYLGTTQLGFYAVAYRVLDAAQAMLGGIAMRMAFPAFSRLQDDPARLRNAFLRVNRVTSGIVMPGFLGLALVAPELIVVVFGRRWEESGPVAAVLFLIGIVYSMANFSHAAFNGAGHPEVALRFRLVSTVTNLVGFFVAVAIFGSIIAVAAAYVVRGYLLLPLNLYWLQKYVGIPVTRYLRELRGAAAASLVMAGLVLAAKLAFQGAVEPVVLLASELAIGGLVFPIALRLADRSLFDEIIGLGRASLPGRRMRTRESKLAYVEADATGFPGKGPDEP